MVGQNALPSFFFPFPYYFHYHPSIFVDLPFASCGELQLVGIQSVYIYFSSDDNSEGRAHC